MLGKSEDAEKFWLDIGEKGRNMYLKSVGEDAGWAFVEWQNMPDEVRSKIGKEMNTHYRPTEVSSRGRSKSEELEKWEAGGVAGAPREEDQKKDREDRPVIEGLYEKTHNTTSFILSGRTENPVTTNKFSDIATIFKAGDKVIAGSESGTIVDIQGSYAKVMIGKGDWKMYHVRGLTKASDVLIWNDKATTWNSMGIDNQSIIVAKCKLPRTFISKNWEYIPVQVQNIIKKLCDGVCKGKDGDYKCAECGDTFADKSEYEDHVDNAHKKKNKQVIVQKGMVWNCKDCDKYFDELHHAMVHEASTGHKLLLDTKSGKEKSFAHHNGHVAEGTIDASGKTKTKADHPAFCPNCGKKDPDYDLDRKGRYLCSNCGKDLLQGNYSKEKTFVTKPLPHNGSHTEVHDALVREHKGKGDKWALANYIVHHNHMEKGKETSGAKEAEYGQKDDEQQKRMNKAIELIEKNAWYPFCKMTESKEVDVCPECFNSITKGYSVETAIAHLKAWHKDSQTLKVYREVEKPEDEDEEKKADANIGTSTEGAFNRNYGGAEKKPRKMKSDKTDAAIIQLENAIRDLEQDKFGGKYPDKPAKKAENIIGTLKDNIFEVMINSHEPFKVSELATAFGVSNDQIVEIVYSSGGKMGIVNLQDPMSPSMNKDRGSDLVYWIQKDGSMKVCDVCRGSGMIDGMKCNLCKGAGILPIFKSKWGVGIVEIPDNVTGSVFTKGAGKDLAIAVGNQALGGSVFHEIKPEKPKKNPTATKPETGKAEHAPIDTSRTAEGYYNDEGDSKQEKTKK